jgi:hypothetical protein
MRRLILLLSVGWVPPDWLPSGACLTRGSRSLSKPPHAAEGDTTPGLRLCRCTLETLSEWNSSQGCVTSRLVWVFHGDWHLRGHGPQAACPLTGHGHGHPMGVCAA